MRRAAQYRVRSAVSRTFCPRMRILRERTTSSGIFGPRDLALLRQLASARALLIGTAARDAASALHIAGFLAGWWGLGGMAETPTV
jgi:hypothetical protein